MHLGEMGLKNLINRKLYSHKRSEILFPGKKMSCIMKKRLLAVAITLFSFCSAESQNPPKREMRGAWVVSYFGIDWPNKTQTPQQQRDAFITLANHHQQTGMNTLYVQVRSQCDAMYPSAIEPWSADLTATQGVAPSPLWDPMLFTIDEAHKRGMEFHAWINPYRAVGNTANIGTFAASHVANQHPEWMLTVGTVQILNPGLPAVRDYITSVVVDILTRYDVDGIHFDDYFYPSGTILDDDAFNADPRGFTVRGDWRRDNINLMIKRVYDSVKSIKPWVKFGVSPSGIYRNSTNPAIGSATSGLEHYTTHYADTKKWLQQGWVDYICPQVYWYIGQPGSNYGVLIPWWNDNASGRHIYIGMAGYKVGDLAQAAPWQSNSQIPDQLRMNRSATYPNVFGQSIYNTTSLKNNKLGFRDSMRLFFYQKPALLPTMLWRDNVAPAAPTALTVTRYGADSSVLSWTKPAATANELDKAKRFVIYRSELPVVDLSNANNIVAITPYDTSAFKDATMVGSTVYYYTVTALDHFHNESVSSNTVISTTVPVPLQLLDFSVNQLDKERVKITWLTAQELQVDRYEVFKSLDGFIFSSVGSVAARNSNRNESYSLVDLIGSANGKIYYKLKMIDRDGSFRFSPIKTINIEKGNGLVKIFPNPLQRNTALQVQIISPAGGIVFYNLLDAGGRKMGNGILGGSGAINTQGLAAGRYVMQIVQGERKEVLQFVVQ